MYRPATGSILLDGRELVGQRPARIARLGVARTFQNLALFANLDVVANLMLGRHHLMRSGFPAGALWSARPTRGDRAPGRGRGDRGAARAAPSGANRSALLPYGIQKRIELGRALAMEPRLLLLDEPVAGMNLEETEDMARYILEIRDELQPRHGPGRARHAW